MHRMRFAILTVFAALAGEGMPVAADDAARAEFVAFERVLTRPHTPGAAGWIADREFFVSARIGFHATNDRLDENARREVLARALLAFARSLFK